MVRIAQGLLHMGKGLVTINPYHSDRMLLNRTAIGSILVILHGALNIEQTLLGPLHYHLYYIATAVVRSSLQHIYYHHNGTFSH